MSSNAPSKPPHKRQAQSKVKPYTPPPQNRGIYEYGRPMYRQRAGAAKLPGSGK